MGFTTKQYCVLTLCLLVMLLSGMIYSLISPFYPKEAAKKGLTPSQYGTVFGIYEIVTCVFGVVFGKFISFIGFRVISVGGLFLTGFATVLFGFLIHFNTYQTFLGFSLLIRSLQGVGQAGINTGILTYLTLEFPVIGATVVAFTESLFGTGMALGPSVGGMLYDLRGFTLPFAAIGVLTLVCVPLLIKLISKGNDMVNAAPEEVSIRRVLKIPSVWIGIIAGTSCITNQGFLSATLEQQLTPLDLSGTSIGLIFFTMSLFYTLFGPVFGTINDRRLLSPNTCILLGAVVLAIAFVLLGPINAWYGEPTLWIVIPVMMLIGIGTSAQVISTLIHIKQRAWENKIPNSIGYNGLLSGIWVAMLHFGGFLGPTVGGILFEVFGFNVSCVVLVVFNIVIGMITIGYFIRRKQKKKCLMRKVTEFTPLLGDSEENDGKISTSAVYHISIDSIQDFLKTI